MVVGVGSSFYFVDNKCFGVFSLARLIPETLDQRVINMPDLSANT